MMNKSALALLDIRAQLTGTVGGEIMQMTCHFLCRAGRRENTIKLHGDRLGTLQRDVEGHSSRSRNAASARDAGTR